MPDRHRDDDRRLHRPAMGALPGHPRPRVGGHGRRGRRERGVRPTWATASSARASSSAIAAGAAAAARRSGASASRRSGSRGRAATPSSSRYPSRSCTACPSTSPSTPASSSSRPRSSCAAWRRRARRPGEAVGVIGVGTLGALAIALLALHSPSRIVAYGVREEELELARQLGATEVVLAGDGAPAEAELDLVVETAGAPAAVDARDAALPPGRPGRAARDRRRGTHADPPLRPARQQGHDPHRQHRVPGVDLVARRRAGRRSRPRPRPDRDAPLPDGRLRGGGAR